MFNLINYVVTFLESKSLPLSYVPLYFSLLYDAVTYLKLSPSLADKVQQYCFKRFKTIRSTVHALDVALDRMISQDLCDAISTLYGNGEFVSDSRVSLSKICDWYVLDAKKNSNCMAHFQMFLADFCGNLNLGSTQSHAYHPQLWWAIDGKSVSPTASRDAAAVLRLFPSFAGNERYLKARSRVHTKKRNRIGEER